MSEQTSRTAWLARLERAAGVPGLVEALSERLQPTDLQSLLLEVSARRAAALTPAQVLEQYRRDRFVGPARIDPQALAEAERLAWRLLPPGYESIELAPVAPLGTSLVLGGISQHRALTTVRNTEVVSDSTNVLALESALRRRASTDKQAPVLLAAAHRMTRAQHYDSPAIRAHFAIVCLTAAGRDQGNHSFEAARLVEHIGYYIRLVAGAASLGRPMGNVRVALTDFSGKLGEVMQQQVSKPLTDAFPQVEFMVDPDRTQALGYYHGLCFKLYVRNAAGHELELGDGGLTDWTQKLLSDRKERFVISGFGLERLLTA